MRCIEHSERLQASDFFRLDIIAVDSVNYRVPLQASDFFRLDIIASPQAPRAEKVAGL